MKDVVNVGNADGVKVGKKLVRITVGLNDGFLVGFLETGLLETGLLETGFSVVGALLGRIVGKTVGF